jgi:hypothetical protein
MEIMFEAGRRLAPPQIDISLSALTKPGIVARLELPVRWYLSTLSYTKPQTPLKLDTAVLTAQVEMYLSALTIRAH